MVRWLALLVLCAGCITQTQATRELELEHEIALDLQRIEQMQRQELELRHGGRVDPARCCACSRVPRRAVSTGKVSVHRHPVKKAVLQDQLPVQAPWAPGTGR